MKKLVLYGATVAALTLAASPLLAKDINFSSALTQGEFKDLSKEAGVAIGYRNMVPSAPLGITGFDVGIEMSAISINNNSTYWKAAFNNDAPNYLIFPKIRARKGLPFGLDIGAMYSYVPGTNVKVYGVELSKAILEGSVATPAVSVRTTYTRLAGVSDLNLQTFGLDASISKGFILATPYAGAGMMFINSEAKGNLKSKSQTAGIDLKSETISVPRVFGGVKLTPIPLLAITVEAEYATRPIYSLKAAVSF